MPRQKRAASKGDVMAKQASHERRPVLPAGPNNGTRCQSLTVLAGETKSISAGGKVVLPIEGVELGQRKPPGRRLPGLAFSPK